MPNENQNPQMHPDEIKEDWSEPKTQSKVFEAVLRRCADEEGFRELCIKPELAVYVVLDTAEKKLGLKNLAKTIPAGTIILFSEEENPRYHILRSIPKLDPGAPINELQKYMSCCYNPWRPD